MFKAPLKKAFGRDPDILGEGLCNAILDGDTQTIKKLIERKANINWRNSDGRTLLMFAIVQNNPDALDLLISAKADLNIQDRIGKTALIAAVLRGNPDLVKKLIDAKADINLKDRAGWDALSWARWAYGGNTHEIIKMLAAEVAKNPQPTDADLIQIRKIFDTHLPQNKPRGI